MLVNKRLASTYIVIALVVVVSLYGAAIAAMAVDWYLPISVVLGLIIVIVTFIKPIWGLYIFVVTMFSEGFLVMEAGPTGAKLVGVLIFGAWIVRSLSSGQFQITVPPPGLFAIVYIVWGLASLLWAIDTTLVIDRAQTLVQSAVLYVLMFNLTSSPERLQKVLGIVVAASLVLASLIILRALFTDVPGGRVDVREFSSYGPNTQAAYFLLGASIVMAHFSQETQLSKKLLCLIALLIVLLAVLATGSRGAMVSLVAILLSSLALDRKSWQFALPTLLVGVLSLLLLPAMFVERVESIFTLSDRGAGRLNILLVGLQIIGAHPLLGVGWGNFGRAFDRYLRQTAGVRGYIIPEWGPHNVFLGALGELGIIGFVLFSTMIVLTVRDNFNAVQVFKQSNNTRMTKLSIGVLLGLLGTLTASMFVDLRYRKIFWLALALAEVTQHLSSEPEEAPE